MSICGENSHRLRYKNLALPKNQIQIGIQSKQQSAQH